MILDLGSAAYRESTLSISAGQAERGAPAVIAPAGPPAAIPAELQRILRPEAYTRWLMPVVAQLTPMYIQQILRGALYGDHQREWELFDLMLDTWPELSACQQELFDGVLRRKRIFEAFHEEDEEPEAEAEARMRLVSSVLRKMSPDVAAAEQDLPGTIRCLLGAWLAGQNVMEVLWQQTQDHEGQPAWGPKSTAWVHPSHYGWFNGRLGLRLDAQSAYSPGPFGAFNTPVQDFPPLKFLLGVYSPKSGPIAGGGMLRVLAWWWCASNFSASWLLNYAQLFGLPFRWASFDPQAAPETIDSICNMLQRMGSNGWAAFPAGTTLELVEPKNQGGDNSPQGALLDRADRYARMVLLGQTMSGSQDASKGGGKAFGEVESDVKTDRIDAAGQFAANAINTQLIPAILLLNYGDTEFAPKLHLLEDDDSGPNAAQRDVALAQGGLKIGAQYLYKKYGIPAPAPGEETIGGAAQDKDEGGGMKDGEEEEDDLKAAVLRLDARIDDDALFAKAIDALICSPGEARDDLGRWTADPSAGVVTPKKAHEMLKKGIEVADVFGNKVRFDDHILEHWEAEGHSKADQDRRLRRLPDAVKAVETPHEVWKGEKQTVHLRAFVDEKSKTRHAVGFIMENGKARTFFHVSGLRKVEKLRKGERLYART